LQYSSQAQAAFAVAFQQMKSHALGGLGTNSGKASERLHELTQER
jgi:hypothetical protein